VETPHSRAAGAMAETAGYKAFKAREAEAAAAAKKDLLADQTGGDQQGTTDYNAGRLQELTHGAALPDPPLFGAYAGRPQLDLACATPGDGSQRNQTAARKTAERAEELRLEAIALATDASCLQPGRAAPAGSPDRAADRPSAADAGQPKMHYNLMCPFSPLITRSGTGSWRRVAQ
jgi:hypothetical protein